MDVDIVCPDVDYMEVNVGLLGRVLFDFDEVLKVKRRDVVLEALPEAH